jgi:type II secretory pathway component PulK
MAAGGSRRRGLRLIHLLLAVPFAAMIWIGFYDRTEPAIAGIPFFYWYQLLWIALGAFVLLPVYRAEERARKRAAPADENPENPGGTL